MLLKGTRYNVKCCISRQGTIYTILGTAVTWPDTGGWLYGCEGGIFQPWNNPNLAQSFFFSSSPKYPFSPPCLLELYILCCWLGLNTTSCCICLLELASSAAGWGCTPRIAAGLDCTQLTAAGWDCTQQTAAGWDCTSETAASWGCTPRAATGFKGETSS